MRAMHGWSTNAELNFLAQLGAHSELNADRASLLRGYLEGAAQRTDWAGIDRQTALDYARQQLERLS